ncbi:hypothetical protein [Maritimibacter fusiformis]|uniref:Uncharacterized protein n=1 Tax=Maritimibacter fusiformis TaxID=2603819 RepID=A0A5D0RGT1_9RHOB|nr:hypothetical protein [Maritimibacter fusiformis]TYB80712.1 hypothetical protein FVF75_13895 [Maritimibacter fusiformis]
MDRTDPDLLDWMNALPDETRARLFRALGLSGGDRAKPDRNAEHLALARALAEAARLNRLN